MELTKGQAAVGLIFAYIICVMPGLPMWLYLGNLSPIELYGVLAGQWLIWGLALALVGAGTAMMIFGFYEGYGFFIMAIGGILIVIFTPIVFPFIAVPL